MLLKELNQLLEATSPKLSKDFCEDLLASMESFAGGMLDSKEAIESFNKYSKTSQLSTMMDFWDHPESKGRKQALKKDFPEEFATYETLDKQPGQVLLKMLLPNFKKASF